MEKFMIGLVSFVAGFGVCVALAAFGLMPKPQVVEHTSPTVVVTNATTSVVVEKTTTIEPSEKLVKVEEGYIRRDVTGMPEDTEWVNLARKVGKDVPKWVVPVQMVKGVPHLMFSDELNVEPTFPVRDEYKGLYVWHQVTAEEVDVMNVVLEQHGKPDTIFSFQKSALRFLGRVYVLEKIEKAIEVPVPAAATPIEPETATGEDPPGTKTVTGPTKP